MCPAKKIFSTIRLVLNEILTMWPTLIRIRSCDKPEPMFDGKKCSGDDFEESEDLCYGGDCCPSGQLIS